MSSISIGVVVPTLNEERDLGRTLASVKKLTDNILVVDSGSTDKTVQIAKDYGAKTIYHRFISFSDSRNFADKKLNTDWILSIEADVVLSDELIAEIKRSITSGEHDAYYIGRINIIWHKPILHTDWGPKDDCHIWLYRRNAGEWVSSVHEEYRTKCTKGFLKNTLLHYNYETISEFMGKVDRYSELGCKQPKKTAFYAPIREFCKRFIYKKGFLDGYHGLFLSYLQSVYQLTVIVKEHEYKQDT